MKRDPADAFVDLVHEVMSGIDGLEVVLAPMDFRDVSFERLFVRPDARRRGLASVALARVLSLADEHGISLSLDAIPISDDTPEGFRYAISPEDLKVFYGRAGFEADPDDDDRMTRAAGPARTPAGPSGP